MRSPYAVAQPKRHRKPYDLRPDHKYIGMYYWCAYWRQWDKILDVTDHNEWVVQRMRVRRIDAHVVIAYPIEAPRTHRTELEAENVWPRFFITGER